jgi:hypothetical protein
MIAKTVNRISGVVLDDNILIITSELGRTLLLKCLGRDFAQLGNAIDLANLDDFGTPAAVLQQLSDEGQITAGTLSCVALKLAEYGLTESDIVLLCTPDASPRTPSTNEFNALQKKAYQAMAAIDADCLSYVLDVLGVVTPNINTMADLLNPYKLFPRSYITLTAPTANGLRGIYVDTAGSVNSNLATTLPASVLAPLEGNPLQNQGTNTL